MTRHPELSLPEGMRYLSEKQQFAVLLDKLNNLEAVCYDNQEAIARLAQDMDKVLAYIEAKKKAEKEALGILRSNRLGG